MREGPDHELAKYLLDRRRFLRLSGGAAMAGFLAACGLSNGSSSTSSPGASTSPLPPVGGDLNLYTWEGYDLTKQFASWRQENNITQHLKFITQPEEVPTVLKGAGGDKWDLSYGDNVVLTDYKNLGLIRPMTTTEVPGLTGLMPAFQVDPWKNADGTYNAAPWTWGFSGLTYRTDRVPAPASWHDILDPKYKGRVSTVDGALNNVALGSLAVGIDPDTLTTAQLNAEVKDYLVQLRGQIRALAPSIGDQISLLVSGDVDYMVVGLTFMDAETAAKGVSTKTVVPSEGAIGWADSAFVPPTAPDPQNALAWIEPRPRPDTEREGEQQLPTGSRRRGVHPDARQGGDGPLPVRRHQQLPLERPDVQPRIPPRTRRRPSHVRPGRTAVGGGQGLLAGPPTWGSPDASPRCC